MTIGDLVLVRLVDVQPEGDGVALLERGAHLVDARLPERVDAEAAVVLRVGAETTATDVVRFATTTRGFQPSAVRSGAMARASERAAAAG
jgi:hypothetical protein